MALIPRWQFMTDDAKSLVRTVGVSVVVLVLALLVLRTVSQLFLPIAVLAVVLWLVFKFKR